MLLRFDGMTRALFALALTLASVFLTGCGAGLVPFTHELRAEHNLSKDDLKNLQFYISTKVTLRRELESGGKQITGSHKLVLVSGKVIEEVVVEEKTPGIAIDVRDRALEVSFEPGSSIVFSPQGSSFVQASASKQFATAPDPFPGNGRAHSEPISDVASDDTRGNYWLSLEPHGTITYQGKEFEPVEGSMQAYLLIDAESLNRVEKSRKVLPGMRLQNR